MKKLADIQQFNVSELTTDQAFEINGGGWWEDTKQVAKDGIHLVGEMVGTVIGGAICGLKCLSNHLQVTEPKH